MTILESFSDDEIPEDLRLAILDLEKKNLSLQNENVSLKEELDLYQVKLANCNNECMRLRQNANSKEQHIVDENNSKIESQDTGY